MSFCLDPLLFNYKGCVLEFKMQNWHSYHAWSILLSPFKSTNGHVNSVSPLSIVGESTSAVGCWIGEQSVEWYGLSVALCSQHGGSASNVNQAEEFVACWMEPDVLGFCYSFYPKSGSQTQSLCSWSFSPAFITWRHVWIFFWAVTTIFLRCNIKRPTG